MVHRQLNRSERRGSGLLKQSARSMPPLRQRLMGSFPKWDSHSNRSGKVR